MAQALGVTFQGAATPLVGGRLKDVVGIDVRTRAVQEDVELLVLSDVDNPLTGADGAAMTYAPQKGASEEQARELDLALLHLAKLTGDAGFERGDGAAGGLGYGLRVFAGARIESGIEFVLDTVGFDARLENCALVITGEGRLDGQSARGKVVAGVCRRCRARRIPVIALAGAIGAGASTLYDQGMTGFFSLCDGPISEHEAMKRGFELLEALAYNICRSIFSSR
jgi:glycerate kinase